MNLNTLRTKQYGIWQVSRSFPDIVFTRQQQLLLESSVRFISYQKGETICKQNTSVAHIVLIQSGLAKLVLEGYGAKSFIVRFLSDNSFTGYQMLSSEENYPFSVIPILPVEAILIQRDVFATILNENKAFNDFTNTLYKADFTNMVAKIAMLTTKNMIGRVAEMLLYFNNENNASIYNHITRKEMADFAGMSVEGMLKILQELKHEKIIQILGKRITINDLQTMQKLSIIG